MGSVIWRLTVGVNAPPARVHVINSSRWWEVVALRQLRPRSAGGQETSEVGMRLVIPTNRSAWLDLSQRDKFHQQNSRRPNVGGCALTAFLLSA
jgi:hypothetical protein